MFDRATAARNWLQGSAYGARAEVARSSGITMMTVLRVCSGQSIARQETIERFEVAAKIRQDALLKEICLIQQFLQK